MTRAMWVSHHRVKLGIEYRPDQAAIRVDCAGDPVCSKANLDSAKPRPRG